MPIFFLGALLGFLGGIFIDIGRVVLRVVRAIMPIVSKVFDVVTRALVTVGRNAGRFFRFIVRAARGLYENIVKPVLESLQRWYNKFKAFLQRVFGPIIKIIDRIQEVLRKIWEKVIAPILDFLDKIRTALRILGALGVKWAAALEKIIAQIQRTIFERFTQIQNWVNTATFWLSILLDPRGWIKATPFLYTIWRFSGNVVNILSSFADRKGINRAEIEVHRQENPLTGVEKVIERAKAGEIRNSAAVQQAAARFRSRQSGRRA